MAALLSLTAPHRRAPASICANETPIHAPKTRRRSPNCRPISLREAGQFTVAIAALNTPPLAPFAADNRRLIGSEVDIAQLVADSPPNA